MDYSELDAKKVLADPKAQEVMTVKQLKILMNLEYYQNGKNPSKDRPADL